MKDITENYRRAEVARINSSPVTAEKQWTTEQLRKEFEVIGFCAPYVSVIRLSDGQKGSMEFKHSPRIYFNFIAQ